MVCERWGLSSRLAPRNAASLREQVELPEQAPPEARRQDVLFAGRGEYWVPAAPAAAELPELGV